MPQEAVSLLSLDLYKVKTEAFLFKNLKRAFQRVGFG